MNYLEQIGLPTIVSLNPDLENFLGGFAPLVVTGLNAMAMLIVTALVIRFAVIVWAALMATKDAEGTESNNAAVVFKNAAYSLLVSGGIGMIAFLAVVHGPNMLYSMSAGVGNMLIVDQTEWLPTLAGPFSGLVAALQTGVSLLVIMAGAFIVAKKGASALWKTKYDDQMSSHESSFEQLTKVVKEIAWTGIIVIGAYVAIRFGPDILFNLLNGGSHLISTPSDVVDS